MNKARQLPSIAARPREAKLSAPITMKTTVTIWTIGPQAPMLAVRVENPPVAIVAMEWLTASQVLSPSAISKAHWIVVAPK